MINTIDTSDWEYFELGKIFIIEKGFYNKKPESSGEGDIPFIGASDKNHGITEYYTREEIDEASKTGKAPNSSIDKKIFKPNAVCVTNNGSVGYAYYLEKEFTCSHDVNPLYRKDGEFNYFTGVFIASIIMHDKYRWDYGRKWRPSRMEFSKIKLPVKKDEMLNPIIDTQRTFSEKGYLPDWEFMEDYIKSLNYKIPSTTNIAQNKSLNVEEWKTFLLTDLFDASMGNGIDTKDVSEDVPIYKYVTRNRNNNGVVNTIDEIPEEPPFSKGSLTLALGGSYLGSCFIQTDDFYTGQNVGVLSPKTTMSHYVKLFIATIIRMESSIKFEAFGRELNSHFRKDFTLKLPIKRDDSNEPIIDSKCQFSSKGYIPDWEFMENYIKELPNGDLI